MMKQTILNILLGVLAIAFIFFSGFLVSRCTYKLPEPEIRSDTTVVVVHDTTQIVEFVEVFRNVRDTMIIEVPTDNVIVEHDTTYIPLPREYVTYKDSSYRAVVSGFMPRLEELEFYPQKEYITIQTEKVTTVKRNPRFSIGVQAGYGITPAGFQPYLGVGGQLNILSF